MYGASPPSTASCLRNARKRSNRSWSYAASGPLAVPDPPNERPPATPGLRCGCRSTCFICNRKSDAAASRKRAPNPTTGNWPSDISKYSPAASSSMTSFSCTCDMLTELRHFACARPNCSRRSMFVPRSTSTTTPLPNLPRSSCTQRMTARASAVTSTALNPPSQFEQLLHEPLSCCAADSSPK